MGTDGRTRRGREGPATARVSWLLGSFFFFVFFFFFHAAVKKHKREPAEQPTTVGLVGPLCRWYAPAVVRFVVRVGG
jgi:hypothetical protein